MRYFVYRDSTMCVTACTEIPSEALALLSCGWLEISKEEYDSTQPWVSPAEEPSKETVWDEMAAAYKEGVQEA